MEAQWHIKVVYEAQFVLVVCSDWWYAICHCFICCGMFVINVCCETVLNVFHLNHLLLITSFSVYESKVVYTCLQKNSSFWSSPITLNGVTERVSAQNLSAIYIENRRESWAVCNATLNITLKHVIWHSCFLFYCFAFANNRIFFFFLVKNKHCETRKEHPCKNCDVSEVHQWVGFLLMFYTNVSLVHQKTIKNVCTIHKRFAFLKVQNAPIWSKLCALFPFDW